MNHNWKRSIRVLILDDDVTRGEALVHTLEDTTSSSEIDSSGGPGHVGIMRGLEFQPHHDTLASIDLDSMSSTLADLNPGKPEHDIVILMLPSEDPLRYCRACMDQYPQVPVLLLGEADQSGEIETAIEHGASDGLCHGHFSVAELKRAVIHAVDRRALSHRLVAAREREAFLCTHDPLTGLPTRSLFYASTKQAISFADRNDHALAVLFLDLDDLAFINAEHGHAIGDRVLMIVGERLQTSVRSSDYAARLGSDDFLVLLRDVGDPFGAATAADKLIEVLRRPIQCAGATITPGITVGIAYYPHDAQEVETLVAQAKSAAKSARIDGINRFAFHEAESVLRMAQ
jgi:diguanylate cyclase (GGDEF)-like protein